MTPREAFEFVIRVAPPVLSYARDLYELFDGNIDAAVAEIEDRRADVERRRTRNDEALRQKHKD